jgi:hypothetical protein
VNDAGVGIRHHPVRESAARRFGHSIHMRLRRALLTLTVACASDPESRASHADPTLVAEVELTEHDGRPIAVADTGLDSIQAVQRLMELERTSQLETSESILAPTLLRAGLLKLNRYAVDVGGEFAATRPHEFFRNEIAGAWLYNGADFDSLLAKYPGSVLADDARYAKLFLVPGGECEGLVECYVFRALEGRLSFLETDARSRHALAVVAAINRDVTLALAFVREPSEKTEDYDPAAVRAHLVRYDSVARQLPSPAREAASATLDSIWRRFRMPR